MLDLAPLMLVVVACHGRAQALDRLSVPGTFELRVAPDELLLLAAPAGATQVTNAASRELGDQGLVIDQTDAFAGWTISGEDALELFARLSAIPLNQQRPSFQQGLVAHAPAKVLVANGNLHLLVPSVLGHYIRERVLSAGADLGIKVGEAVAFEPAAAMESVA